MHEALHEALIQFLNQVHDIAGIKVSGVSIFVTGHHSLVNPDLPIITVNGGVLSISYQEQHIPAPIRTDLTLLLH